MTEQLALPFPSPAILLRWLGAEGVMLEAGSAGLIVDARAWRLLRLADERGVECFYL